MHEVRRTSSSSELAEHLAESTQHVYTLRRGRTSAVVESLEWAHDKLWFGMSTRKRTIHVFATNPFGGKPDGGSHLAGVVVNTRDLVSLNADKSILTLLDFIYFSFFHFVFSMFHFFQFYL